MIDGLTQFTCTMIWVTIVVLAIIVEASTYQLVSCWFGVSGIVALIISIFSNNFVIQLVVFLVLGIILLIFTRPLAKKITKNSKIEGTAEGLVEEIVEVIKDIPVDGVGEVKARYEKYSAISKNNEFIPAGTKVKIVEINGNKVIVETK